MAGPEPRCPAPTCDATSGARPAPPDKRRRAEPRALFRRAAQDGGHAGGAAPPRGGHGAWARPAPGLLRAGGCHPAWVGPAGAGEWLRRRQEACERAGGPGVQGGAPATSQEPGPGAGVGVQRGPGGGSAPRALRDALLSPRRPSGPTRSSRRSSRTRSGCCWARAARRSSPATTRTSASASRLPRR